MQAMLPHPHHSSGPGWRSTRIAKYSASFCRTSEANVNKGKINMNQSIEEKNKTLVLDAFETLFKERGCALAEPNSLSLAYD